jgi:hypothetical protein
VFVPVHSLSLVLCVRPGASSIDRALKDAQEKKRKEKKRKEKKRKEKKRKEKKRKEKKRKAYRKAGTSSRNITNFKQSILETFDIYGSSKFTLVFARPLIYVKFMSVVSTKIFLLKRFFQQILMICQQKFSSLLSMDILLLSLSFEI